MTPRDTTQAVTRPIARPLALGVAGLALVLGTTCGTAASASPVLNASSALSDNAGPNAAVAGKVAAAPATATSVAAASVTGAAATEVSTGTAVLAAPAGSTILERVQFYADALAEDPLWSDEASAMLYGDAYPELRELQAEATVPSYIVFDRTLDYESVSTVAQILSETLPDEEMVVLVVGEASSGPRVAAVSPDEDRRYVLEQQFSILRDHGASSDSVLERLRAGLEGLKDPQRIEYSSQSSFLRWLRYFVASSPLRTFAVAMGLVVLIAAALWFLIPRGARRRRYRIPKAIASAAAAADRGAMRRALSDDALGVVDRLEKLQTGSMDPDAAAVVEHGLDAYGLARRIADDTDAREDDLAGAMVLMGIAEAAVTQAESATRSGGRGGRGGRGRGGTGARGGQRGSGELTLRGGEVAVGQRLCSIDPRHGPAKKEIDATVAGRAGTLTVPACAKCLHDDRSDNPLRWLTVAGKPYVLRDTVWARTLYGGTQDDLVDAVVRERAERF